MSPNLSAINPEAFKIYAICAALLALNLMVLGGLTGGARGKNKSPGNPEDAGKPKETALEADHPNVVRVRRAHMNALENVPTFWAIGLIYVLMGASPLGAKAYFITFTAARFLHSFFHLKAIQPFRSISFGIGSLTLLGMVVQILMGAFKG